MIYVSRIIDFNKDILMYMVNRNLYFVYFLNNEWLFNGIYCLIFKVVFLLW